MADTTTEARELFARWMRNGFSADDIAAILADRDTLAAKLKAAERDAEVAETERDAEANRCVALAAKLEQAKDALAVCERAADMLTAYAELIRRDGSSRIDQHHYLPEVEHVAQTLREAAPPPAPFAPDDAALAQEPAPAATEAPAEPVARMHPDGERVMTERQYAEAARQGGASWVASKDYTTKLYTAAAIASARRDAIERCAKACKAMAAGARTLGAREDFTELAARLHALGDE